MIELDTNPSESDAIRFVLQLGHALHRYGTPAHRLEDAMTVVASQLGVVSRFISTPTGIFASFGPVDKLRTTLIRVSPGEMNLERLSDLDRIASDVVEAKITPAEGASRIDVVLKTPPHYGPLVTIVCYGLAASTGAHLFGGGLQEMKVSLILGLLLGVFAVSADRLPAMARIFCPVAAFGASVLSTLGVRFFGPYSTEVTTLAALVFLLPGLMLVIAMTELATQNLISGTTRLTAAALVFLQLGFGVALGRRILPPVPAYKVIPLADWTIAPVLLVITIALAVLFKARMRDGLLILFAGALAYLGGRLGARFLGSQLAAFIGATALGVGSNTFARLFNRPSVITLVPGIMLLVPGAVGFRSLEKLMTEDVVGGVGAAFFAVMVVVAIVAGTLVANALVPPRKIL